jgi:hypothetical protein
MSRTALRETSSCPQINSAVKHSKRKRMKCATTDLVQTTEEKRRFDENYEAIFGKKDIPHGRD